MHAMKSTMEAVVLLLKCAIKQNIDLWPALSGILAT